jgi:hypothetical protein
MVFTAAALIAPTRARAHMGGMFDCAQPFNGSCIEAGVIGRSCGAGTGTCHGGLVPENTTTQLQLDGIPADGYLPGQSYELTITVLGASIPVPLTGCPFGPLAFPDAFNNLAGFNLQPTGGLLSLVDASDTSAQVLNETECQRLRRLTGCDSYNYPPCPTCDDTTIVSSQATHTLTGNKQFSWKLRWTAPDPGVGPVTFYLAGNVVNGNCRPDVGDLWSVAPGFVVGQASP